MNPGLGGLLRPADIERALLQGFVDVGVPLAHGRRKSMAVALRIRSEAVNLAVVHGPKIRLQDIAEALGVSSRSILKRFRSKEALFAFPPPEMATALGQMVHRASSWPQVADCIRRLFDALDANPFGKELISSLARLHELHPELLMVDGYFAQELRAQLKARADEMHPHLIHAVGYFTEGCRQIMTDWSGEDARPINAVVSEQILSLIEAARLSATSQSSTLNIPGRIVQLPLPESVVEVVLDLTVAVGSPDEVSSLTHS
jgi:AcrR family transcriptional regulator